MFSISTSCNRRSFAAAVIAPVLLLAPAGALADAGEWMLGGQVVGELPAAAGLDALAQVGVSDSLWVAGRVGGRYGCGAFAGDAVLGLLTAWDVVAWVPELMAGVGVRGSKSVVGELLLTASLRRFISFDSSVTVAVSGGWRTDGDLYGGISLGVWKRLP